MDARPIGSIELTAIAAPRCSKSASTHRAGRPSTMSSSKSVARDSIGSKGRRSTTSSPTPAQGQAMSSGRASSASPRSTRSSLMC